MRSPTATCAAARSAARRALAVRHRVAAGEHRERAQGLEARASSWSRAPGAARAARPTRSTSMDLQARRRGRARRASSATRGKSSSTPPRRRDARRVLRGPAREQVTSASRPCATRSRRLRHAAAGTRRARPTAPQPVEVRPLEGEPAAHRAQDRASARARRRRAISSLRSTTSSAAADGVGARRSATRSAIVTSVSWPTPEIVGIVEAARARATASSLKGARSSGEPPPRARIRTSKPPRRLRCADRRHDLRAPRARPGRAPGRP